MVFVSVGQHDREHVIHAITDVAEVRQNHVDARLGLFGKQHTAVDDEQFAVDFEDGHVATDLADSAERNYAKNIFS